MMCLERVPRSMQLLSKLHSSSHRGAHVYCSSCFALPQMFDCSRGPRLPPVPEIQIPVMQLGSLRHWRLSFERAMRPTSCAFCAGSLILIAHLPISTLGRPGDRRLSTRSRAAQSRALHAYAASSPGTAVEASAKTRTSHPCSSVCSGFPCIQVSFFDDCSVRTSSSFIRCLPPTPPS